MVVPLLSDLFYQSNCFIKIVLNVMNWSLADPIINVQLKWSLLFMIV